LSLQTQQDVVYKVSNHISYNRVTCHTYKPLTSYKSLKRIPAKDIIMHVTTGRFLIYRKVDGENILKYMIQSKA
jgi:hypothetical protein